MRLLLHICCAPCSVMCIKTLREENILVDGFWYNPNIHPYTEYQNRLNALKEYSKMINLNVIYEDYYGLKEFTKNVIDILDNRCSYCYLSRLEKTVLYAKENGYDAFSTTLLISPYQNHDLIKKICEQLSIKHNIKFIYKDFRKYYFIGKDIFKETNLYMQKYCGCIFSEEERYLGENKKYDFSNIPFVSNNSNFEFKKIENNENIINKILDENISKDEINNLINNSLIYGLKKDGSFISYVILLPFSKDILELKYLFTKKEYRNKGYANKILKIIYGNYKQNYKKMIIGLKEDQIPFFVKQGFNEYYERKNDLIYYVKKLK